MHCDSSPGLLSLPEPVAGIAAGKSSRRIKISIAATAELVMSSISVLTNAWLVEFGFVDKSLQDFF